VIHMYFGYNIIAIQKRLTGIALFVKEMLRKTKADFTNCSENNDFEHNQ
jgi:hypothetical protein